MARAARPSLVVIAGPNGIYDSSGGRMPALVAVGNEATTVIYDEALWERARREANHGS